MRLSTKLTVASSLASIILVVSQVQDSSAASIPLPYNNFTCEAGQHVAYGEAHWSLPGSTFSSAVAFMSKFCEASIGNTALNCTGEILGSTREVRQGNGVYIQEKLAYLTTRASDGMLEQVVTSVEPVDFDEGGWTYTDYAHLSTIQVYKNLSDSNKPAMKMWTNRCVSNYTQGLISIATLLNKAQTYYIPAIANTTKSS